MEDMRRFGNIPDAKTPEQLAERDEYDQNVTISELMKRLPNAEIVTCEELDFPVDCCGNCHDNYPPYYMYAVELLNGKTGLICCSVRDALFHRPQEQYVDLEEALGGGLRVSQTPDEK